MIYQVLSFVIACQVWLATADSDATVTKEVFLDISIGGKPSGRIVLGVFGNAAPKTVANFVALADHEVGKTLEMKNK
jgi:hypothetical protein